jgi:putative transposase
VFLTYRYGLRPKRHQYPRLEAIHLEGQRLLYNAALEERSQAWGKSHWSVTRIDQTKSLTTIRAFDPQGYGALPYSIPLVAEQSRRSQPSSVASGPSAARPASRASNQGIGGWFGFSEFSRIRLTYGALVFKGMPGRLKLDLHRPLPDHASIRSCTLTKEGRILRVALQIEVADVHSVRQKAGNLVGIDWGVERLATLSIGETIANPRFGAEAARGMGKAQRKLANRRKSYLHQLTGAIAARFGSIAVEELTVKTMTTSAEGTVERPGKNVRQKAGLNREILEVSPGMMISMLRYKAEGAGGWFAVIDARNTPQECSQSGGTVERDLSVRIQKMRALRDGGPPRRQRGPERSETGRSGSVERICARKQRPDCRPSLRKPQARSSTPNSGKDFELRHYKGLRCRARRSESAKPMWN